jgi:hypothetical protein
MRTADNKRKCANLVWEYSVKRRSPSRPLNELSAFLRLFSWRPPSILFWFTALFLWWFFTDQSPYEPVPTLVRQMTEEERCVDESLATERPEGWLLECMERANPVTDGR